MKGRFIILIGSFIVLISSGCTKNKTASQEPEKILDREIFIKLMADMDITDAALKTRQLGLSHDSIRKLSEKAFDSLYIYYGTTPEIFKQNIKYYQRDMEEYQRMMDEKIELLSRKKDSITLAIEPVKIDTSKARAKATAVKPAVKIKPVKK